MSWRSFIDKQWVTANLQTGKNREVPATGSWQHVRPPDGVNSVEMSETYNVGSVDKVQGMLSGPEQRGYPDDRACALRNALPSAVKHTVQVVGKPHDRWCRWWRNAVDDAMLRRYSLWGAQTRSTSRPFAQWKLIFAHLQHSKFYIVYTSQSPFNAWGVVCLHGCAIACALKNKYLLNVKFSLREHCLTLLVGRVPHEIAARKERDMIMGRMASVQQLRSTLVTLLNLWSCLRLRLVLRATSQWHLFRRRSLRTDKRFEKKNFQNTCPDRC